MGLSLRYIFRGPFPKTVEVYRGAASNLSAGGDGDKVEGAVSKGGFLPGPGGQDRGQRQRRPAQAPKGHL